jgi:hypothetical protein
VCVCMICVSAFISLRHCMYPDACLVGEGGWEKISPLLSRVTGPISKTLWASSMHKKAAAMGDGAKTRLSPSGWIDTGEHAREKQSHLGTRRYCDHRTITMHPSNLAVLRASPQRPRTEICPRQVSDKKPMTLCSLSNLQSRDAYPSVVCHSAVVFPSILHQKNSPIMCPKKSKSTLNATFLCLARHARAQRQIQKNKPRHS